MLHVVTARNIKKRGGNTMKKLIALLLVLAMALSLVACGAKAPAEAPKTEEPKTEAPKEDTKKEEPKVEENLTAT